MLNRIMAESQARREKGRERWESHDPNLCMACHAYGHDKRSLFISCFYEIAEFVPEFIDLHLCPDSVKNKGYYLRICKNCRGEFLAMLREWFAQATTRRGVAKDGDGHPDDWNTDNNIPVRVDGRIIMMNEHQYEIYKKQREEK